MAPYHLETPAADISYSFGYYFVDAVSAETGGASVSHSAAVSATGNRDVDAARLHTRGQ